MKTMLRTTRQTRTDVDHEVSQFIFTIVSATTILIGIWGAVCFLSGLLSHGFLSMARGYITAITGM